VDTIISDFSIRVSVKFFYKKKKKRFVATCRFETLENPFDRPRYVKIDVVNTGRGILHP